MWGGLWQAALGDSYSENLEKDWIFWIYKRSFGFVWIFLDLFGFMQVFQAFVWKSLVLLSKINKIQSNPKFL